MLKIIVPINVKSDNFGPLIIRKNKLNKSSIDKKHSENILFLSNQDNSMFYCFNPSRYFHKAATPIKGENCFQIMLQLNPSNEWKLNSNLYKRQFKQEPKFTDITNLFSKYIKI